METNRAAYSITEISSAVQFSAIWLRDVLMVLSLCSIAMPVLFVAILCIALEDSFRSGDGGATNDRLRF